MNFFYLRLIYCIHRFYINEAQAFGIFTLTFNYVKIKFIMKKNGLFLFKHHKNPTIQRWVHLELFYILVFISFQAVLRSIKLLL